MTHNRLPEASGRPAALYRSLAAKVVVLVMAVMLLLQPQDLLAQAKDKPGVKDAGFKEHSISKAAIFSAVLPGLGQAYNRKYWKIPIIYAGFGVITYFIVSNNNEYQVYKEAYIYQANGDTTPIDNPYIGKYSLTQLEDAMDYYRRNRDLSYIIGGIWYIANILEAYVDAHFFEYDISDDLSMKISPTFSRVPAFEQQPAPGIKISFKF